MVLGLVARFFLKRNTANNVTAMNEGIASHDGSSDATELGSLMVTWCVECVYSKYSD